MEIGKWLVLFGVGVDFVLVWRKYHVDVSNPKMDRIKALRLHNSCLATTWPYP